MNSSEQPSTEAADSRGGDRRQGDRRRVDRRAPLPWWRRPWAFVGYGVAGALLLVILLSLGEDEAETSGITAPVGTRVALPAVDSTAVGANAPVRDAYDPAAFEALLAEGAGATGRRVRTTLYCEPIRSVAMRRGAEVTVAAAIAEHADEVGRVPAAECHWGEGISSPEVLLVVPPALAEQFATRPEVEQSFVMRREVPAEVEWIGRSEALALRTVAVLTAIQGGSQP